MRERLALIAAALVGSTGSAAMKVCGMIGWQIACDRSLIAAIFLALAFREVRVRPTPKLLLVGLAYAGTVVLFALANRCQCDLPPRHRAFVRARPQPVAPRRAAHARRVGGAEVGGASLGRATGGLAALVDEAAGLTAEVLESKLPADPALLEQLRSRKGRCVFRRALRRRAGHRDEARAAPTS